ncbi:MAG: FAD-dependent monooxygenase [Sphingopyxis sp.]
MADIKTALVVGGGIGGMAAAIGLAERGVAVHLIDLDPEWKVYGAGITITGPTLRAYQRLGMIDAIKLSGAITNGTRLFQYDGTWLQDLDEPSLEEGLPATGGIMRPDLHRIMQGRVKSLNISVALGITVQSLDAVGGVHGGGNGDGVDVRFTDGGTGRYDLVVGADSIYSKVRDLAFPHMAPAQPTGQGCWRISLCRPPGFDRSEFYLGHKNPAGINACGPDAVYLWMLTPDVGEFIPEAEQADRLQALLADFGGNVAWVRDNRDRWTWVNYRPLAAAIQPRPWSMGRIVLLGDATHATTPHLASGAGMAVESAIVLADELARPDASVAQALAAYEQRRYARCHDVVETSLAVGRLQVAGGSPQAVGGMIGAALHRLADPF